MTRHADSGTRRRSNLLVLVGLASFVLGLLAVYAVTRGDAADASQAVEDDDVPVLVAASDIQPGALGEDLVANDAIEVREVPRSEVEADMLRSVDEIAGAVLTSGYAEGEALRSTGIARAGGTRPAIPEGFEAVSVAVDFVAGGAATIVPGDRVNLFLVASGAGGATVELLDDGPPYDTPRVQLLLTNVTVLDVQRGESPLQVSSAGAETGTGTPDRLIVVVAVDTTDAEKVIFAAATPGNSLYFSRVPVDASGQPAPPAGPTTGADAGNILEDAPDGTDRSAAP